MKRVLITGAAGFIGSHAVEAASHAGYEVHAPTRAEADLLDAAQTAALLDRIRPTHLLHFAWYVAPAEYWTSSANETWADASATLFRLFADRGGQRLVGIGSSAEYAWNDYVLSETSPTEPATPYGRCKLRTFDAAMRAGVSAAWARLFMVYGPGEPRERFVPTMIRTLLHGGNAICAPADARRDFIHVADAAAACVAILSSEIRGAVNVGSGHATPLRDVASVLTSELGHSERIAFQDGPGARLVVGDVARLREEVGFRPRFSLREGLRDAIDWWRDR